MYGTDLLNGAETATKGHWRIKRDPYRLRAATIYRAFEGEDEMPDELGPRFSEVRIGFCDDCYWGIRQEVWIVVCEKR